MKKHLLFVIPSLAAGGGEKSLVSLLNQIDYNIYNVDLFLFNHEGLFMEYLPKQVNVLPIQEEYQCFSRPMIKSVVALIVKGKVKIAYNRVLFAIKNRGIQNVSVREQYTWKHLSSSMNNIEKYYDAAIGFLEKSSIYYCIEKVSAHRKIGWVHNDYDKLGMDPEFDLPYFNQLNTIVTVSEECANVFKRRFPNQKNKVDLLYNVVSPKMINKMADEQADVFKRRIGETVILTVARLHPQKNLEIAIESCKELINKGYNIRWYVIGEGDEREKLEKLIKQNNLEKHFILLGLRANPYPYIKEADIYVQTSKFEGKSIAIDEAKILSKPIIVTDFSTAKDQITNGHDGLIVSMNANGVVKGIEKVITDKELQNTLVNNLKDTHLGTEEEIEKLYKII